MLCGKESQKSANRLRFQGRPDLEEPYASYRVGVGVLVRSETEAAEVAKFEMRKSTIARERSKRSEITFIDVTPVEHFWTKASNTRTRCGDRDGSAKERFSRKSKSTLQARDPYSTLFNLTDLLSTTKTEYKMERRFLLDVVV